MSWLLIALLDALVVGAFCTAAWKLIQRRRPPTEREQLEQRFEHQLSHDDLTKLPNRGLFRDRLERALARSVRRRQSCAVLSIDIDRFKLVTDGLGPAARDSVLREVATRLDSVIRPEDSVARTGGDEFMVLLEAVAAPGDATAVADGAAAPVRPPVKTGGSEVFVSASVGIALGRGGRDRSEDVMQNAEVAVHRA